MRQRGEIVGIAQLRAKRVQFLTRISESPANGSLTPLNNDLEWKVRTFRLRAGLSWAEADAQPKSAG